jgi:hypothetical protein
VWKWIEHNRTKSEVCFQFIPQLSDKPIQIVWKKRNESFQNATSNLNISELYQSEAFALSENFLLLDAISGRSIRVRTIPTTSPLTINFATSTYNKRGESRRTEKPATRLSPFARIAFAVC